MAQNAYLSPFYDLVEVDEQQTTLHYGVDSGGNGPCWDEAGKVLTDLEGKDQAWVYVHALGDGRYRIVGNDLAGGLRLTWGDEFYASGDGEELTVQAVVLPRRFQSYRFLWSGMDNDCPQAQLLHELGGGWESLMGGILTLTVPVERADEFEHRLVTECPIPSIMARRVQ